MPRSVGAGLGLPTEALHELAAPEDALIPEVRLAPPAECLDGVPPPQAPDQAPALELGAPSLRESRRR